MKQILLLVGMVLLASTAWGQIPSEGFERWDSVNTVETAPGWYGGPFGSSKVENAHSGRYAASVWNWYYYGKGYIVTGPQGTSPYNLDLGGVPIAYKPVRLSGYYRYDVGNNGGNDRGPDSGVVIVYLKRYNTETKRPDTIGFAQKLLGPSATYIPFTVDIQDYVPGVDPDSVVICFVSSDHGFCNNESDGTCCYLSIDDIQLSTASGVAYGAAPLFESVSVLPNPVRSNARLRWNALPGRLYRLALYDAAGRLARTLDHLTGGEAILDCAGLPSGNYLFEIRDDANTVVARGKISTNN